MNAGWPFCRRICPAVASAARFVRGSSPATPPYIWEFCVSSIFLPPAMAESA
ncbi:Uncharacterised protein [Mycobacteroides abscessus subsp. abscessus]|nr:Uncharacterised protein [Mycobacteroides abscessus subsp. abscessus]